MQKMNVIAVAPSVSDSENIVVAACRAGEIGCLDGQFGFESRSDEIVAQLMRIRKFTNNPFGIVIGDIAPKTFAEHLEERCCQPPPVIILSPASIQSADSLKSWLEYAQGLSNAPQIIVQVTCVQQARLAARENVSAIILKGSESGGLVGDETAFVLAQRWAHVCEAENITVPFYVQGGIGLNTAAAVQATGAKGIVLDSQLLLAKESCFDEATAKWIQSSDGSDVHLVGQDIGLPTNVFARRNCAGLSGLNDLQLKIQASEDSKPSQPDTTKNKLWFQHLDRQESASDKTCFLLGQDICLAKPLARQFNTVGGIIDAILSSSLKSLKSAASLQHIAKNSPLAESHQTDYPLLQGPMTRVSDTAQFAESVAKAGALPFLALSLMRGTEVEKLLSESTQLLKEKQWGVGVLGFLPPAIRAEQSEVILKHKPPFAIIAGGRPDQAKQYEDNGIKTYLHVPSPGLLEMFLKDGAKRFIFEGRECGGHVGPRSSFVLWQSACDIIAQYIQNKPAKDLHLVFAGGIHDDLSAAMIAGMTAPLAKAGVKIGLLMGTAYLFTKEAVDAGAIVPRFQEEAIKCDDTSLLQTGPGHAIRCIKTPYFDVFESEKKKLTLQGASHEEMVRTLEGMNIGRLRVASKGLDRAQSEKSGRRELVEVSDQDQYDRGMYMIGQVASMHKKVITMGDLHEKVCDGGSQRLSKYQSITTEVQTKHSPSDIAIVGMSCYYPDAANLQEYWENILERHYAVREVPMSHWDWRLYYDEDPKARDRIVSKWGGFLKDIKFDPLRYGITPKSMEVIEPLQLLTLEAVRHGLADAGYTDRPFNRDRTACIVGIGGGAGPMSVAYGFRSCMRLADYFPNMPILSDEIIDRAGDVIPDWTEDSFPGMLANICSGRVANRFNLGGPNYAIDAACASSLASLDACVRELEMGTVDMAIAMGADAVQTPLAFMAFSKTHALSQKGHSRPFDAEGDGIVLAEGVGVVILKRLADAEKDGDKIYAVIKGIGSSSDGKDKGLTAPNAVGQQRALYRAYEKANVEPKDVGLIEAHGTGTVVGDQTEATALSNVLREYGADLQSCALGSVKSMIGHSKCAAGVAGLIKSALALHHKILPPTLVQTPNPNAKFEESSLYLNTELRPWVNSSDSPRYAGVSAFGFGGTNFHTVLEEYRNDPLAKRKSVSRKWPTELFVFRNSREKLLESISKVLNGLKTEDTSSEQSQIDFVKLVTSINAIAAKDGNLPTLTLLASSKSELAEKLELALSKFSADNSESAFEDPRGLYFNAKPTQNGKIAFLFPGQGSQYPNMLAETAVLFPEVRESIDLAEATVGKSLDKRLGQYIYPPSFFSDKDRSKAESALAETEIAQTALGACNSGMLSLMKAFGIESDIFAGHSYGEYSAIFASGKISEKDLYQVSYQRGLAIQQNASTPSGMVAVSGDAKSVQHIVAGEKETFVANVNSPKQTVVSTSKENLDTLVAKLNAAGLTARQIPVSCGFHSPFVDKASKQFASVLQQLELSETDGTVYSNTTAKPHQKSTDQIRKQLSEHMTRSVNFVEQIENMFDDGVRTFIEVGPGGVLSGLARKILAGKKEVLIAATDAKEKNGVAQLLQTFAKLITNGISVNVSRLSELRGVKPEPLKAVLKPKVEKDKPSIWTINGVRSKMAIKPEPLLLGQPHPDLDMDQLAKATGTNPAKSSSNVTAKPNSTSSTESMAKPASKTQSKPSAAAPPSHKPVPPTTQPQVPKTPVGNSNQINGLHSSENGRLSGGQTSSNANLNGALNQSSKPDFQQENMQPQQQPNLNHYDASQVDNVMLGFQNVMAKFLETQRSVMLSYLQGDSGEPLPFNELLANPVANQVPQQPVFEQPAPVQPPVQPVVAPNAVNSSAANATSDANQQPLMRAAAEPVTQSATPESATPAPKNDVLENGQAPVSSNATPAVAESGSSEATEDLSIEKISEQLMELVSERTGYPIEMLDLDLDLEADLGIDSIKRVEILGSLAEFLTPDALGGGDDEAALDLEKLSGLRTLGLILEYLEESMGQMKSNSGASSLGG